MTGRTFEHPRHALRRLGVAAQRRFSQNFICQASLARRIVALAGWPRAMPIVEVGGGTGVLTDALADAFDDVLVIEIDRALAEHLRARFAPVVPAGSGVTVMEADARSVDLALVRRPPMGVFGNLPYANTTDLLRWLIRQRRLLAGAVIMVQREYAARIVAKPRTKAYGSLSVHAALYVEVTARFAVGPGSFHPRPKVGSTVLAMTFRDPPGGVDPAALDRVVRGAFAQRRKLLRSNLEAVLDASGERVARALEAVGAAPKARAEELSPEQYVWLTERLVEGRS